ncbi:Rieske (2Fe-2S) domain-containing protein [Myxococcus stipitatus DSM 14675]|uniref:Rieske (2Fe-2S) domain-containing protein n=1 Tax=Myxococcus stipitatus (strain DSM 14675 / JCM 12634 / Mx s8) TaxID=1278073 RepID=L7UCL5_MYXSD|nr:Rieske (2Fe-2S) protein [Myxococcus stipitatus]AGC46646.1 Rieske (2Fe-2S) domain-containing protein [Myxococcus stipitatus DSM 14675]
MSLPPRQRVYTTPPDVTLCPVDALQDPGARNIVMQIEEAFFHGFLVRKGDQVHGYVDRCPHAGLPLARVLDQYLTPDKQLIHCSWHGALFQLEDGQCVGGPCAGASLTPWPVKVEGGMVVTA